MKKTKIAILTLICLLLPMLSGCNAAQTASVPRSVKIDEINTEIAVGNELKLNVTDDNNKALNTDDLLWNSSDPAVATVSSDGTVSIRSYGSSIITVSHKQDLSVSDSLEIFAPYQTVEYSDFSYDTIQQEVGSEFLKGISEYVADETWKMADAIYEMSVSDLFMSFFDKEKYLFSYVVHDGSGDGVVLYSVTDWTNQSVQASVDGVTSDKMFDSLCAQLQISDASKGNSFEYIKPQIQSLLSENLPSNGIWRLDLLDPNYQYRIVIKGDIDCYDTVSIYQNGLITGFTMTVKDLFTDGIDTLLNDHNIITKNTADIVNVDNLRFCIEYRKID